MKEISQWISALRALASEVPVSSLPEGLDRFLYAQECFFLLARAHCDSPFVSEAKSALMLNRMVVRERYRLCQPLFEALNASGVPYAVVKGAVLSQSAYKNPAARVSSDMDLLVSPNYFEILQKCILKNGFIQGRIEEDKIIPISRTEKIAHVALTHQAAPFLKQTQSRFCPTLNLDMNLDIFWGEQICKSAGKTDMDTFLSHGDTDELDGVVFRRLSPVYEFIALCTHHYKDMNSIYLLAENGIKLILLCDILFYLRNHAFDEITLRIAGDRFGATPYMYFCVMMAHRLFGDGETGRYLDALETKEGTSLLSGFGLTPEERQPWGNDFLENLFDEAFCQHFASRLTPQDLKKQQINRAFM